MSEGITHIAVVDDVLRLAPYAPDLCPEFADSLAKHRDLARLGGITRHGDRHIPGLLDEFRSQRASGTLPPASEKLAFVLGWLCHRATDRQMKPVFRRTDPDSPLTPTDCSIYHDITMLRAVYGENAGGDLSQALRLEDPRAAGPAPDALRAVESLFHAFWRRMLLSMHTFIPDDSDIHRWLDQVIRFQQRLYVDLARYAQAWSQPDPDKVRRFVDEPHFYDPGDSVIRLVRAIQRGMQPSRGEVASALKSRASGESLYAQALHRAWGYMQAASEFMVGRITREDLRERIEIGRPELAG